MIYFIRLICFFIFLGRGYQYLFWDAPFRSLLWDQNLLEPLVNFLGFSWSEYVTNLNIDYYIQLTIKLIGISYFICAFFCLKITPKSKSWIKNFIFFGSLNLVILALLLTKEKFYHLTMFLEHSIQFGVPILFVIILKKKKLNNFVLISKIIIALCFICHGIYALGILYPTPANYVTMVINILNVKELMALNLLKTAAILDFAGAILLFIPKTNRYGLIYLTIWGLITAFARIINGFTYDISFKIIHEHLFETIYRLPHGLFPLTLLYFLPNSSISRFEDFSIKVPNNNPC